MRKLLTDQIFGILFMFSTPPIYLLAHIFTSLSGFPCIMICWYLSIYFFFISPDFVTQRNFFVGSSAHLFDKFKRGGHKGLQYCGIGQFFLRYFGNFNLEMRYRGVRQTCGMRFSFSILHGIKIILQVLQVFRAFSSFPLDIPNET